jgi:hypothetical protein
MSTTYLMTSTLNGFVAGPNHELDWLYDLPPGDRDFTTFLDGVGAVAMGASTYEAILRDADLLQHPERWHQAHGDRPVWVFTVCGGEGAGSDRHRDHAGAACGWEGALPG